MIERGGLGSHGQIVEGYISESELWQLNNDELYREAVDNMLDSVMVHLNTVDGKGIHTSADLDMAWGDGNTMRRIANVACPKLFSQRGATLAFESNQKGEGCYAIKEVLPEHSKKPRAADKARELVIDAATRNVIFMRGLPDAVAVGIWHADIANSRAVDQQLLCKLMSAEPYHGFDSRDALCQRAAEPITDNFIPTTETVDSLEAYYQQKKVAEWKATRRERSLVNLRVAAGATGLLFAVAVGVDGYAKISDALDKEAAVSQQVQLTRTSIVEISINSDTFNGTGAEAGNAAADNVRVADNDISTHPGGIPTRYMPDN